jgi:hypothetical protein
MMQPMEHPASAAGRSRCACGQYSDSRIRVAVFDGVASAGSIVDTVEQQIGLDRLAAMRSRSFAAQQCGPCGSRTMP